MSIDDEMNAESAPPSCPKCGGAMWDNRASKRNPRAPDYKCKDRSCDGVIWPPRGAAAPVGAAGAPAGGAPAGGAPAGGAPAGGAPAGGAPADATAGPFDPDNPRCPVCGGPMWDDRSSKRNPRAPDFKCKNKPKTIGGPGCPGVIWPPRDGERRAAAPSARAPQPGASQPRTARDFGPPPPDVTPPPDDRDFIDDDDDLPF